MSELSKFRQLHNKALCDSLQQEVTNLKLEIESLESKLTTRVN